MSGKGDSTRPCDKKRFDSNFDQIKWEYKYESERANERRKRAGEKKGER
jgi:hypothetical protein